MLMKKTILTKSVSCVTLALCLQACSGDDGADSTAPASSCEAVPVTSGPGGRIVGVSDTDMLATAYADNQLGTPLPGLRDTLFTLNPAGAQPQITGSVEVSNAVTGPVWIFDTNRVGSRAYLIETNPPPATGVTTLAGLRATAGTLLQTINICGGSNPRLVSQVRTVDTPLSVSLRADARWLAVASRGPVRLVLHEIKDGDAIGPAVEVALPASLVMPSNDEVAQAAWSPDGRFLALSVRSTKKLQIFEATSVAGELQLRPSGNPVDIDEGTFGGRWSTDGKFFYLSNVRVLSRPVADIVALLSATPPAQIPGLIAGSLQTVQLFGDPASPATPAPRLIQTLPTPAFPEGIAVSRDGTLVATVNLQTTSFPASSPLFSPSSSITLLSRAPQSGQLTQISNTSFEGILPEGVDFDPDSKHLAVAVFHPTNADRSNGAVDIWKIEKDAGGSSTGLSVVSRTVVPRGAHFVQWLR